MDELGFLESNAPKFCHKVLEVLDGPYTVLGAVKPRNTAFLERVRCHKKVMLYQITENNRNTLYQQMITDLVRLEPTSPFLP